MDVPSASMLLRQSVLAIANEAAPYLCICVETSLLAHYYGASSSSSTTEAIAAFSAVTSTVQSIQAEVVQMGSACAGSSSPSRTTRAACPATGSPPLPAALPSRSFACVRKTKRVRYLPYINLVINLIFIVECVATVSQSGTYDRGEYGMVRKCFFFAAMFRKSLNFGTQSFEKSCSYTLDVDSFFSNCKLPSIF